MLAFKENVNPKKALSVTHTQTEKKKVPDP